MDTQTQYKIFIENLRSKELRLQALNDLKNLLNFTSPTDAMPVIKNVGINEIFKCLNDSDRSHVDLSCELLKTCFNMFEPEEVVRNYITYIMYLLRHENPCVRQLAIDVIYKVFTSSPGTFSFPQHIDVFVAISQMAGDQDVGIANKAVLITSNLPQDTYSKVLDEMKIILEYNSSCKCNAFEIIVNISKKSNELFEVCKDHGYIDFMVSELETEDILYQLNILELLSQLTIVPYGISYLIKNGLFKKMVQKLQDLENNPLKALLITGYIKFFGTVTYHYSKEVIHEYPMLIEFLLKSFDEVEQTIFPVVLDTLGVIGSTIEGKLSMAAFGSKYTLAVEKIGELIRNSGTDIKTRALYCFANLIDIERDLKKCPADPRVTLMTREWFRSLSKQPSSVEVLFGLCKNPFPDIQFAAFTLLDAVCQHHWGEELVANCAGFIEFLLDRNVDLIKQLKEVKYDVIKRLSMSTAFDANIIMRLQTYVEQGPFYSESQLQVAVEEGE
ncbi:unnamed protein product [Pieris macdunnoughi]|uniref:26S proteasome non-ATPase regulatory subunit 5 n=1 Tax=Pieris macdunnoughi TaxID=345717 RepID=A0A821MG39_9NEOP|nr:unnamed protein product [Pieris macdunnoughi]